MKNKILIAGHALFWALILSFFIFVLGNNIAKIDKIQNVNLFLWVHFGVYGLINISIFYFNLFVLIPSSFSKKKYLKYIVYLVGTVIFYGLLKYLLAINFSDYYLTVGQSQRLVPREIGPYFFTTIFPTGFMLMLSFVYRVVLDWFKNETIQTELIEQRKQAELQFLKSQINPHFLFNSLNNIYALAYKKAETTADAILKLSDIMRYMLKESHDGKVDFNDEIAYVYNYIELNKIRYKEGVFININHKSDNDNYRIMPMLLISFIENIFKHGIVNDPDKAVEINIELVEGKLNYSSRNYIRKNNKDESSGIGMQNIYRRLELMYKNIYSIDVNQDEEMYLINLKISLV